LSNERWELDSTTAGRSTSLADKGGARKVDPLGSHQAHTVPIRDLLATSKAVLDGGVSPPRAAAQQPRGCAVVARGREPPHIIDERVRHSHHRAAADNEPQTASDNTGHRCMLQHRDIVCLTMSWTSCNRPQWQCWPRHPGVNLHRPAVVAAPEPAAGLSAHKLPNNGSFS
jgi:hypothetical protein